MQQWWFGDGFGLLLVINIFYEFSIFFYIFIYIHEYANEIICISGHKMKGTSQILIWYHVI